MAQYGGTYGVGGFENDLASDWSSEFEGVDMETGLKLIRDALNFDAAFAEGDPDMAEVLAVAAAELVIVINGHSVPEAPDTHHLDEIVFDDSAPPLTPEDAAAKTEALLEQMAAEVSAELGFKVRFEELDIDDDDEHEYEDAEGWIARTHPASDPHLTDLARRAVARVRADSTLADLWDEDDSGALWRSYMAALAAKLAEEPAAPSEPV